MIANMHAILVGLLSVSHTPAQAEHAAREVLDQHAHGLAEQQRKAIEDFDLDDHWGALYRASDVEGLPDLIDPKAQRASTQGDTS